MRRSGKRYSGRRWAWTAGVMALGLVFSLSAAPSDTLRHKNWWNFYERGRARFAAGDLPGAREDFETALGIRRGARFGYDKDHWRVRTYGMHFQEGYFPNRELGAVLVEQGLVEEAFPYLEISLEQAPSGRAKFYLNRAREEVLSTRDVSPPRIEFEGPAERWTNGRRLDLRGRVEAEGRVTEVRVDETPLFLELAEVSYAFDRRLPLEAGPNRFEVEARDLKDQVAREEVRVVADWRAPTLTITSAERLPRGWRIAGRCADDYALNEAVAGGRALVPVSKRDAQGGFAFEMASDDDRIRFELSDRAGNQLRTTVEPEAVVRARLTYRWQARYAQAGGAGTPAAPPATPEADRLKPALRLGHDAGVVTTFEDSYFIDGWAQDGGGLESISINGEPLLAPESREALEAHFARLLPLDEGTNRFQVLVRDLAGNEHRKTIAVVRKKPEYLDEEFRLTVGVPPMREEQPLQLAELAKLRLEDELLRDPVRFHLLERDEGWDFILREQELSVSDLSDPKAALLIGKMLPAQLLLMGGLTRDGGGITAFVKVVESGNGRQLFIEDVYSATGEEELDFQLAGLVMKIEQRFPLVEGTVESVKGTRAMLNVGASDGVRSGTRFLVVQKESGDVKVEGEELVEAVARRVKERTTQARILPSEGQRTVQIGDLVYAR